MSESYKSFNNCLILTGQKGYIMIVNGLNHEILTFMRKKILVTFFDFIQEVFSFIQTLTSDEFPGGMYRYMESPLKIFKVCYKQL